MYVFGKSQWVNSFNCFCMLYSFAIHFATTDFPVLYPETLRLFAAALTALAFYTHDVCSPFLGFWHPIYAHGRTGSSKNRVVTHTSLALVVQHISWRNFWTSWTSELLKCHSRKVTHQRFREVSNHGNQISCQRLVHHQSPPYSTDLGVKSPSAPLSEKLSSVKLRDGVDNAFSLGLWESKINFRIWKAENDSWACCNPVFNYRHWRIFFSCLQQHQVTLLSVNMARSLWYRREKRRATMAKKTKK